ERRACGRGHRRDAGLHGQHRRRAPVTPAMTEPAGEICELTLAHTAAVLTVHLDRWGHRAHEEAVGGLERDLTVGAGHAGRRIESLREPSEELAPAENRPRDSGAHPHVIMALR